MPYMKTSNTLEINFEQIRQTPCIAHQNAIIKILIFLKRLLVKVYYMKINKIPKSVGIAMLIEENLLLINALLQDIVFSLEEILFLGKVRNKT